jgi:hypothetical protein
MHAVERADKPTYSSVLIEGDDLVTNNSHVKETDIEIEICYKRKENDNQNG